MRKHAKTCLVPYVACSIVSACEDYRPVHFSDSLQKKERQRIRNQKKNRNFVRSTAWRLEEEEEERSLIVDLKRHTQLAVAWNRHGLVAPSSPCRIEEEEEEEERDLINDLKRYGRLAVAWNRHGFPVPRWTLTRYGPDDTLLS